MLKRKSFFGRLAAKRRQRARREVEIQQLNAEIQQLEAQAQAAQNLCGCWKPLGDPRCLCGAIRGARHAV